MSNIEITNKILKFFYDKNLEATLDLDIDDSIEGEVSPQVQINVDFDGKNTDSFAFFYSLADKEINMCAIYELKNSLSEGAFYDIKDSIEDKVSPFQDVLMPDDVDDEIHLFASVPVEEFSMDLLDQLVKFFDGNNKAVKYLRSISK